MKQRRQLWGCTVSIIWGTPTCIFIQYLTLIHVGDHYHKICRNNHFHKTRSDKVSHGKMIPYAPPRPALWESLLRTSL